MNRMGWRAYRAEMTPEIQLHYWRKSPPSPVSSVRSAIHSSLRTTQTQCPPPSIRTRSACPALGDVRPAFPAAFCSSLRTTWNGSYSSLSNTPAIHAVKNRDKRRSNLSLLFTSPSSYKSHSAPNTPPGDYKAHERARGRLWSRSLDSHRRRRISVMARSN
ncbi:hypothetical protein C8F01DRAFT_55011 [Mycena amicta]|nr:hypothetical protein C8F01DRAFT_55011 [Mycena amicta]